MGPKFERFLKNIGIVDLSPYQACDFDKLTFNKEKDILNVVIFCPHLLSYAHFKYLMDCMEHSNFKTDYRFKYRSFPTSTEVYQLLKDEFVLTTGFSPEAMPSFKGDKQAITFNFNGKIHYDSFKPVLEMWEQLLDDLDITNISLEYNINYDNDAILRQEEQLQKMIPEIKKLYASRVEVINSGESFFKKRAKGNYEPIQLQDLDASMENVSFSGQVFHVEEKVSRKGKLILTLFVYDKTDSVEVIIFENLRNFKKENLEKIKKVGTHLSIRGGVRISNYSQEVQVIGDFIEVLEEPFDILRTDDEEDKRVELHVHTKMSNMDAVTTISDYVKLVSSWGHKAIGLTDHGVVQAFPEAQRAGDKHKVKILYGSEMYMVDEQLEYIMNPSKVILNNATYVCLDFETTGLSSRYDKIIEFGAVKFKDGMVVDMMDLFIDPEMELSDFTTELTGITQEMVEGKTKIKEALQIMKDFLSDAILVTHNASFDIGFLNEAFKKNNQETIKNPVIDTLSLSRYLFPLNKAHNLGALCRQFEVKYDEKTAHRANYDAEVLNSCWIAMLSLLTKNNFNMCHYQLGELENAEILKYQRAKHVTVYAKNKEGLKDLFKLISMSHIQYLSKLPKIPRRELENYRENLIIGSACFNGEIFDTAFTKSKDILKEKMGFYDFIEVQPLENYSFLVEDGQVDSMNKIKRIVLDIIEAAGEVNKPVCATSDCHYANPEDKIYRDVYITAKAVGGLRHPLNPHRRDHQVYENPDQHIRTTREMLDAFSFLSEEKAHEIVIKNTNMIADQIDYIYPIKDKLYTPEIDNCENLLVDMCYKKAHEWYGDKLPDIVEERLKAELDGIIKYGYSVQYYIAHCIVQKSREDGYMVGSRGSVGSSFVATMASITEVNPLMPHYRCETCKYSEFIDDPLIRSGYDLPEKECPHCHKPMVRDGQNIPFATFLGFKAEKVPDIDLNFSGDNQAQAHEMTKVLLGEQNVFRAGTIETVAEKTAYGYVLGYFENQGIDPSRIRNAEKTRISIGCQDVKRTTGQHPGGIIVIPRNMDVYDFTAVQYPADDISAAWKTTHFDFHAIHDNVLKLDLLGHVDPTALKMLGDLTGILPESVPLTDRKVISLFSSSEALNRHSNYLNEKTGAIGLPEFGTPFVRQMLEETKPSTFADLLIISGLSHGTDVWNGNAQDLINSKTCTLQNVIGCRDDIMVWLSSQGIEPSTAFKIMEDVRKGKRLKTEYEDLLREHKIPEYYIEACNKIKYLFPKAHAVAYVMMACRVAWYKVYKPLEYYATFFSTRAKQFDIQVMLQGEKAIIKRLEEIKKLREQKLASPKEEEIEKTLIIALEMAERGYEFENLDLDKSDATNFLVDPVSKKIIPPFIVIDNLGANAALTVIEARKKSKFHSIEDLTLRTKLNNSNIEMLKTLGVLKNLPESDQMSLFDFDFGV